MGMQEDINKPFLLTYQTKDKLYGTFSWFSSEDEMLNFIDTNPVHVIEAYHIKDVEILQY